MIQSTQTNTIKYLKNLGYDFFDDGILSQDDYVIYLDDSKLYDNSYNLKELVSNINKCLYVVAEFYTHSLKDSDPDYAIELICDGQDITEVEIGFCDKLEFYL